MKELTQKDLNTISGGIFINPVTVMIAVRVGQIVGPYVISGGKVVLGAAGGAIGGYLAD